MGHRSERKKDEFKSFMKNLGLPGFKVFSIGYRNIIVPPDASKTFSTRFNEVQNKKRCFHYNVDKLDEITNVNTLTGKKSQFKKIEFWDKEYNKHELDNYKDFKEQVIIMRLSGLLD